MLANKQVIEDKKEEMYRALKKNLEKRPFKSVASLVISSDAPAHLSPRVYDVVDHRLDDLVYDNKSYYNGLENCPIIFHETTEKKCRTTDNGKTLTIQALKIIIIIVYHFII